MLLRARHLCCLAATGALLLALLFAAAAEAGEPRSPFEEPMRFVVVRSNSPLCGDVCPEWISAQGTVKGDTANKLKAVLNKLGRKRLPIVIASPGGDVDGALATGRLIRANKLEVAVGLTYFATCSPEDKGCKAEAQGGYRGSVTDWGGFCNSACPWILAGGVRRLVGTAGYLGVHQITTTMIKEMVTYKTEYRIVKGKKKVVGKKIVSRKRTGSYKTTKLGAGIVKRLRAYQKEMGVEAGFLDRAQAVPAADILRLDIAELMRLKLVTDMEDAQALAGPSVCDTLPVPRNCHELPASEMRFLVVRSMQTRCEPLCTEWISAEGAIAKGSPAAFAKLQKQLKGRNLPVVLHSPGGDPEAAMKLGRAIRKAGLTVVVGRSAVTACGDFASACKTKDGQPALARNVGKASSAARCTLECVLVLAAGADRLGGVGAIVSWGGNAPGKAEAKRFSAYLKEMGVGDGVLGGTTQVALTAWSQGRHVEIGLLTKTSDFESVVDKQRCEANPLPDLCRESAVLATTRPSSGTETSQAPDQSAPSLLKRLMDSNPDMTKEMRFALVRGSNSRCEPLCPEWILAAGRLTAESPAKLKMLVGTLGDRKPPIVLSSLGGPADVAIEIGRLIRAAGLNVVVGKATVMRCSAGAPACSPTDGKEAPTHVGTVTSGGSYCLAECVLLLAAGVERNAGIRSLVGWVATAEPSEDVAIDIETYFAEMGIATRFLREAVPAPLTEWARWRMVKMGLLTAPVGAEQAIDGAACSRYRTLCRESDAKQQPVAATQITASRAIDSPTPPVKDAMRFVYVRGSSPLCEPNCPEWISAEGTIDVTAPARFEQSLVLAGGRRLPVIINSKGGDVDAAMALGRIIRKNRLDTSVAGTRFLPCAPGDGDCRPGSGGAYVGVAISSWGTCAEACPIMLAGGIRRLVGPGRAVSIQALSPQDKLPGYFYSMGVDWQLFRQMRDVPHSKVVDLEIDRLTDLALATGRDNVDELAAPNVCRNFPKTDNCRLIEATQ